MKKYTWKFTNLDQNWADHAVAFVCRDVFMNQWLKVFNLSQYILITENPDILTILISWYTDFFDILIS